MRYASVCSGIGTCALAWRPLGWETVWFSEIEKFPSQVLAHRWPDVPNHGDMLNVLEHAIRRLRGEETHTYVDLNLDLLAGGTPCQAFSVAGNRLSLEDARGNLTLAYVQLVHAIDALRPGGLPYSVWENVPGVFSTPDNAFGCFLGGLAGHDGPLLPPEGVSKRRWRTHRKTGKRVFSWPDAGVVVGPSRTVAWLTTDAQFHGLPQRRRRVVVVSCPASTGLRAAEVLFERRRVHGDHPPGGEARQDAAGAAGDGAAFGGAAGHGEDGRGGVLAFGGNDTRGPISVAAALNTNRGCHNPGDFEAGTLLVQVEQKAYQCQGTNVGEMGTLRTGHNETNGVPFVAIPFDKQQITHPENRANPQPGDMAPTLAKESRLHVVEAYRTNTKGEVLPQGDIAAAVTTMTDRCSQVLMQDYHVRRFVPVECERLQGIDDNHTLVPITKKGRLADDGPRYKAVGNAWARTVFTWLGKRIAGQPAAA